MKPGFLPSVVAGMYASPTATYVLLNRVHVILTSVRFAVLFELTGFAERFATGHTVVSSLSDAHLLNR